MKRKLALLLGCLLVAVTGCGGQAADKQPGKVLQLAVAASLEPTVRRLAWTYQAEHRDVKINITSGASGTLARQAQQGTSFDLFMPAGKQEMDELAKQNLVDTTTMKDFLGNRLVVIVPQGHVTFKELDKLKNPEFKKIGVGELSSVPVGRYAKQTLEKAGLWKDIEPKVVYGNSARNVLQTVSARAVDAGIVYRTDGVSDENVHIAMEIDEQMHDPVRYPMAVMKNSKYPDDAKDFLKFLESPTAKQRFMEAAFQVDQ